MTTPDEAGTRRATNGDGPWDQPDAPADPFADDPREAPPRASEAAGDERMLTTLAHARTAAQRIETATRRDGAARMRDLTADVRDQIAAARDDAATARDKEDQAHELLLAASATLDEALLSLRHLRNAAAIARRQAAEARAAAAADRRAAAADRANAQSDRRFGGLDELTGVFRRGAGQLALMHEIDRARRLRRRFAFAVLDVDDLKLVNDHDGHAAGDALLFDVATAIVQTLRSYDVTVRWGGDEFVCAMSDVSLDIAIERTGEIQRLLGERVPAASISAGHAELLPTDTLDSVIAWADAKLYLAKRRRRS
ncbi:MAG TPA: GGDEF domain-containing protein [Conexibacter sp.]|jgi:diguanylate cyclase (GGDEF)-like protein|nr:GGDEF domain-containing protein [Conexibacter sp.]